MGHTSDVSSCAARFCVLTACCRYLKPVDKYGENFISAYITAGHVKFLLLHPARSDDAVKSFFQDVHALYLRVLLNPFYKHNSPIESPVFDERVRALLRRLL
eukprot:PLAT10244.1.p2 GENE.PLAT10244.1~~PLAT10244.1.p2  ORF type:complete len:102 (+),score=9.35 PLAT10244.1:154-459(+)